MVDELMGKLNAYAMNHSSFLEMIFAAQPMGFGEGAAARLFIMPDENAEIVKGELPYGCCRSSVNLTALPSAVPVALL